MPLNKKTKQTNSIQQEDYIEKHREKLITATRNNIDNMRINRTKITRKEKWKEKNNCMYILSNKQATSHTKKLDLTKKGKP